ncbi:MAG: hypothetical protein J6Q07_01260 [Alistipes sp.]|nr:hypothetical protein [Alistipes sp.]
MKKTDFHNFKLSLNVNIEIDANVRKIMEKIKLLNQFRDIESLSAINTQLSSVDAELDNIINSNHCTDDTNDKA